MLTTFIPEVWAARLMENLKNNLVFANLANRDYEGEISDMGSTVHVLAPNALTVRSYTKGGTLTAEDATTGAAIDLAINKGDYYNFFVDDVDKVQARADVIDSFMTEAAYGLANSADAAIAAEIVADGTQMSALTGLTATNAYNAIVDIKTAMDEANIPAQGRWLVVPPEIEGLLLKDQRFAYSYAQAADDRVANGHVAKAAGFDIYVSNNAKSGSNNAIFAGHPGSLTYADQILKTEAYRPSDKFCDGVKGLHVYGTKVLRAAGCQWATYTLG